MGAEAQIGGLIKFEKRMLEDTINPLPYPQEWYKDVEEGTWVVYHALSVNTSSASQRLAEAVGMEGYTDFKNQVLNTDKINWELLYEMEEDIGCFNWENSVKEFYHAASNYKLIIFLEPNC